MSTRPPSAVSAPKSSRATSVRPEPSSPASPVTSPGWMSRSNGAIALAPPERAGLKQRFAARLADVC